MAMRSRREKGEAGAHELISFLHDNYGVIIVSQPDGSVGTSGTTADHDNIAGNGVPAAIRASCNPLREKRSHNAGADPLHPAHSFLVDQ